VIGSRLHEWISAALRLRLLQQDFDFSLIEQIQIVAALSLSDDDVLRKEQHRLQITNEERLLHAAALLQQGHFLDQGSRQVVEDLLFERLVQNAEELVEVLVQVGRVLHVQHELDHLILHLFRQFH